AAEGSRFETCKCGMCSSMAGVLIAVQRPRRRKRLGRPQSCPGTLQQVPKLVHPGLRPRYWLRLHCHSRDGVMLCGLYGRLTTLGAATVTWLRAQIEAEQIPSGSARKPHQGLRH